ncbi:hypothetical protein COU76_05670 [Candidatus Peregrinibacteria bacterium CG10_big_fil_rev_8_21_14_0_10_49_10]|nr:MAG: hypothetical protein COU76_05670 [Candidatus Peregrinibacteria bacterium CG10_big_fil_rev_8_21_14_0_10_49_10]
MSEALKKVLDSFLILRTTRRASFCLGLEYLNTSHFLCVAQEDTGDFDAVHALFPCVHSGNRAASTSALLAHPVVTEAVASAATEVAVIPYVNSAGIEAVCAQSGWKLFAPTSALVHEMESKDSAITFLREVCPEAVIPSLVQPFGECSWKKGSIGCAIQRLDQVYTGGKGTLLLRTEDEFAKLTISADEVVKYADFIEGPSLNINAVATPEGTVTTDFSLQIIGPPECSVNSAAYCGNDWDSASVLPSTMQEEVHRLTRTVGDALSVRGYRGWFGMDFLVDSASNHVYVMEINPRLQGSTSMVTITECLEGLTPLWDLHLMAHLGIPPDLPVDAYSEQYRNTTHGAHILVRIGDQPLTFSSACHSGLYTESDGKWAHTGNSIQLADARSKNGMVVHGLPPLRKQIAAHDRIATIQSPSQVLEGTHSSVLRPSLRSLIALLREGFSLVV